VFLNNCLGVDRGHSCMRCPDGKEQRLCSLIIHILICRDDFQNDKKTCFSKNVISMLIANVKARLEKNGP